MSLAEVNDSCNGGESSCTNLGGLIETVINGDRLDVDKIATEEEESLKFEDVNYGVTPVVGFEKLSEEEDGSSMGTSNSSHPPSDECQPDSRSDGSDSGLGSDGTEDRLTSAKNDSFSSDELPARNDSSSLSARSSLPPNSTPWQYCDEPTKHQHETQVKLRSTLKRPHGPDEDVTSSSSASSTGSCSPKRAKKSIAFGEVDVYYFPRVQGFTCVPSQGGSTLGMILTHTDHHTFTIAEHVSELRRNHREILARLRDSSSSSSTSSGGAGFNGSSANSVASSSSSDSDTDDQNTESELDPDNYFFLQPVPTRQRRALLRAAGVRKIDTDEKDECRDIRSSREFCGCSCKGYCDPDTCDCSQAGIKCQVDRLNFPCGCTHDGCANSSGRIEFNPMRVRTHFIHTMMRLEMEKKREQEEDETNRLGPSTHQHRHVPPQSITSSSQDSAASTSASFQNYCDVYYNQIYGPSSSDDPPGDPGGPNHSVPPSTSSYSQPPSASYPPYSQVDYGPVNYTPVLHHDSSQFAPFPTNVSPPRNYHIHPSHHESFSDLLQARYSDAVLDSLVASSVTDQKLSLCHDDLIVPSETEVEPENFGEIIKKTMVESASA